MRNHSLKSFFIVITLLCFFQSNGQEQIMHGTITTFDSIPLIGASVEVLSTKQKVLSDTLGNFLVVCSNKDKLKVTAHGFYDQKVKVNSSIKSVAVNLRLKPGEKNREYAIGYGHVSDKEKLVAVANLNKNDVDFSQYSNMYELLRGRFSGVQVAGTQIIIRGVSSINGSNAALIVVDGTPMDSGVLSSIPPVNVKSVSVLKGGGAAIYGTRGANGVVLIETKKGGDDL